MEQGDTLKYTYCSEVSATSHCTMPNVNCLAAPHMQQDKSGLHSRRRPQIVPNRNRDQSSPQFNKGLRFVLRAQMAGTLRSAATSSPEV